jgi:LysM repeat protein
MAGSSPRIHHTDQSASPFHWRPILTALATIGAVALTVMAAFTLSLQDLTLPALPPISTPVASQPTPSSTPSPSPTFTFTLQPSPTSTIPAGVPVVEPTFTPIPIAQVPTSTATNTPTSVPPPTSYFCTPRTDWDTYTVRPGDTLATVAARYRIAIPELMQANCMIGQTLYPGQVIYVPPVATPGPTPTLHPPCGPPAYWVLYRVKPGDTLYSLATRTYSTVYEIMWANCLNEPYIYVGQWLWLKSAPHPPPPRPTPTHTRPAPPSVTHTPTATASPTSGVETPPTHRRPYRLRCRRRHPPVRRQPYRLRCRHPHPPTRRLLCRPRYHRRHPPVRRRLSRPRCHRRLCRLPCRHRLRRHHRPIPRLPLSRPPQQAADKQKATPWGGSFFSQNTAIQQLIQTHHGISLSRVTTPVGAEIGCCFCQSSNAASSGRAMLKVLPTPNSLSAQTRPSCRSMIERVMYNPKPTPRTPKVASLCARKKRLNR